MSDLIKTKFAELSATHPQNDDLGVLCPLLLSYAHLCNHITEFGVDDGTSTWAWLYSTLYDKDKVIRSYDIYPDCLIKEHREAVAEEGIDWIFEAKNTLAEDFEIEETDLLFIDTEHNYRQLLPELRKHGNKAKKFLMFHDTYTYGTKSYDGYDKGLNDAIAEWMIEVNKDKETWIIDNVFLHSNGLTILRRIT